MLKMMRCTEGSNLRTFRLTRTFGQTLIYHNQLITQSLPLNSSPGSPGN